MKKRLEILLNGIGKENPVWVLVLGTCPTLATTSSAFGGVGMGISVLFVLLASNIVISLLKKIIPDQVRIPCFIVVTAGFVTILRLILEAFLPSLYKTLGIFLPLIVVNCIILARAEAFASKNSVGDSALDAIGMGLGFTIALFLLGSFREILGAGSWFGLKFVPDRLVLPFFASSSGGFLAFGCLIAVASCFLHRPIRTKTCGDCGSCKRGGKA